MRPQIYEALSTLDDKIKLRVFPESRNFQEVPQEIQQEIHQENSEKHPDNLFKVITYTINKSQDAEFDGAGFQEVDLG